MVDRLEIKALFQRGGDALRKRPSLGQGTYRTTFRSGPGMKIYSSEADWQAVVDLPPTIGGEDSAPTPGFYLRAAIGTCVGTTLKVEAAAMDIDLDDFSISIEADYDARGEMGIDNSLTAYLAIRCDIVVNCNADDEQLVKMLERAKLRSTVAVMLEKATDFSWSIKRA